MISLEGLEAAIGLYLSDVADITHEDLLWDSMVGTEFAAAASLGLTVESGDLIDRNGFLLIRVGTLEAEPLANAFGRHCYSIELRLRGVIMTVEREKAGGN